jgi:hypothetical protein
MFTSERNPTTKMSNDGRRSSHAAIETDLAALLSLTTTRYDDDGKDDDQEKVQQRNSNNNNNNNNNGHNSGSHHRIATTTTLVCDLQYGFPNEKRPRREKIGALAAQLGNFLHWQHTQLQLQQHDDNDDDDGCCIRERSKNQPADVLLVYLAQDDDAVTEILHRLRQKQQQSLLIFAFGEEETQEKGNIMMNVTTTTTTTTDERLLLPSADTLNQPRQSPPIRPGRIGRTTKPLQQVVNAMKGRIIYLSPDADAVLSSFSFSFSGGDNDNHANKDQEKKKKKTNDDDFRTITTFDDTNNVLLSGIIVGGLIDRRHIQTNRSLSRAMELNIPTARWPLPMVDNDDDNTNNNNDDWDPHEPLNVDCILQGMQDWLWTGDLSTSIAHALDAHVQRHPGRPRHKTKPTNQPTKRNPIE